MFYDPDRYHRRSIRLPGYDYTQAGAYFVTLVTYNRIGWLGKMNGDGILLSQAGQVAEGEWLRLESRFPGVWIDVFIIMPNHVHGIIILPGVRGGANLGNAGALDADSPSNAKLSGGGIPGNEESSGASIVGARQEKNCKIEIPPLASPLRLNVPQPRDARQSNNSCMPRGPKSGELGTIVGSFKSTTARLINGINHTPGAPLWQRNYYERIIRNEKDLEWTRDYIQNNQIHWSEDEHHL